MRRANADLINVRVGSSHDRFWSKVDQTTTPDGCWVWTAATANFGYGVFRVGGKNVRAHRWVSEQADGPIPAGTEVRHTCDNPPCVRLSHLVRGSHAQNMHDVAERKRWGGPRNLPSGDTHPRRLRPEIVLRGSAHPLSRLTEQQVREIRQRHDPALRNQSALAREYGVTSATVNYIVLGKTWRHVDG